MYDVISSKSKNLVQLEYGRNSENCELLKVDIEKYLVSQIFLSPALNLMATV